MFIKIDDDTSINTDRVRRLVRNNAFGDKTTVVYGPGDFEVVDVPFETLIKRINGPEAEFTFASVPSYAAPRPRLRIGAVRPGTCGKIPTGKTLAYVESVYSDLEPCSFPEGFVHVQCAGYVSKADELSMQIAYTWPTKDGMTADAVPAGTL